MRITFLGHAAFLLEGSIRIYIDPYHLKGNLPEADVILITHPHFDHCSGEDVIRIATEKTKIFAPKGCKVGFSVSIVEPNSTYQWNNATIQTVPAYNVGKNFHPPENRWVGYVVNLDGVRIYHAGDTDLIDEMRNIQTDIALLPVGGTYTMDVSEAVRAAEIIKPRVAVPMHYGDVVGSKNDALNFCARCPVECKVLEPYEPWEVKF